MNNNEILPEIKKEAIENVKNDAWDFIYLFADKYYEMIEKNGEKIMEKFNEDQHTLLAYLYLDSEVCNGGFIQLIQNGYGGYIFNNPFSEYIKSWGAEKAAEIVEKAKIIYNKYKKELEEEKSIDEFSELYKEITDFEPLENEYYKINDSETERIKAYNRNTFR
jgi:thiaminase